jgi:hypothetical protein
MRILREDAVVRGLVGVVVVVVGVRARRLFGQMYTGVHRTKNLGIDSRCGLPIQFRPIKHVPSPCTEQNNGSLLQNEKTQGKL